MKLSLALLPLCLAAVVPFVQQDEKKPARPVAKPVVGEPAPTFRLNDHTGRAATVDGSSEKWTVLAFFPKAATPG